MPSRAAVILAAGQGTRMKSPVPKVLHKVGGRTHLDRMIDTVTAAGCERIVVVVGTHSPAVRELVEKRLGPQAVAVQEQPLGTAHAVLAARENLADFTGDVLITYADAPLLTAQDLEPLFLLRERRADLAMLSFEPVDPLLYGRVIKGADGHVIRIVEARDATEEQRAVRCCNAGMMVADRARLFGWLSQVGNQNAKGEYYLTDIVGIAVHEEALVRSHTAPESAVMGCDTPAQLAQAEHLFQQRQRQRFLADGVTMLAPETVHFSWDTQIAPGAIIEQFVVFGVGVRIEEGAVIRAFSHLEGATVRSGALIGPYARLRPGAEIGKDAHIGNFVEVKNVRVGEGAKANHLSYLGDGSVGAKANIGAGTIFCNYDGFFKYETHVGEGAFVGSNTALVAPVTLGAGAMTGSGSVITQDVAADALALERSPQTVKAGWAAAFRKKKSAEKAAKAKKK
ncbi:bifunctional UDP-N-acetylglucosamine diphosphorylase/glucosamine-1-phosphate N-acetyltransferase GlmU [Phenylobacterium sp.]|jgi:bifunctional UDP-N-acetylglucosamine pyrophosphorylase/glucosamine-1-phosphate N-acetyltransferase|uniref:bifunctional UDP-N-acetylglucosamine diphosphorylase/glucosamine-1-phosphate N-acetyltransferase GlmU n=1 Tax=Phenylobacterium sp. TaxID=1871053 RepID=UPI002F957DDC